MKSYNKPMFKALSPGAINVKCSNLKDCISAAKRFGFEGVEFGAGEVADLVEFNGAGYVKQMFSDAGVKPAGSGLPTDWRGTDEKWHKDLEQLPRQAKAATAIGGNRMFTWIMPGSNDKPMDVNRRFHVDRFKPIAKILNEHGVRLGLEFIGPKTIRDSVKYPFIYRMEDMLSMAHEIGPNVGLLLDCWHWYTSGGILADLYSLTSKQVVYVHVNDAPKGIHVDKQIDNTRDLPGATGVIDIKGFLKALDSIGYDGPVVPEPFKKDLADLKSDDERLKVVSESMNKIFTEAGL
jgi:sugar phosphate isomerase/epimerase